MAHIETDPYIDLPTLTIPSNYEFIYHEASDLIDDACSRIIDSLPPGQSQLVIGFDTEYQADTIGQGGPGATPRSRPGQIDVISIATAKSVYVFKVCFDSRSFLSQH